MWNNMIIVALFWFLGFLLITSVSGKEEGIFDWRYYTSFHPDLKKMSYIEAHVHFFNFGYREGRRTHAGHKTIKLVLMTKNEESLAYSWILYHGHIFGFENLYVLDGTDGESLDMNHRYNELGVHVYKLADNLNKIDFEINNLLTSLQGTCDFLIKLDTDEFLAILDTTTNKISLDGKIIFSHLDSLPYNGSMYKVGFQTLNYLHADCNHYVDATSLNTSIAQCTTKFTQPFRTTFKSFFPSWTFGEIDLGSHGGRVTPENNYFHTTDLLIVHYQKPDVDTFIKITKSAVLNHLYLNGTESDSESIEKLSKLGKGIASVHKVGSYLNFLRNKTQYRINYAQENHPKQDALEFSDMYDLLKNLDLSLQLNYISGSMKHVRKKIAFCIQGKSDSLNEWAAHFQYLKHSGFKLFLLSFDTPFSQHECELVGAKCIFAPNSTWTTGRNNLLRTVLNYETEFLLRFHYIVLSDDDVVHAKCHHSTGCSGKFQFVCCLRQLYSFLASTELAVVNFVTFGALEGSEGFSSLFHFDCGDGAMNAYHRETIGVLLPYYDQLDNQSWWYSQLIMFNLIVSCVPGYSMLVPMFEAFGPEINFHSPYPRELNGTTAINAMKIIFSNDNISPVPIDTSQTFSQGDCARVGAGKKSPNFAFNAFSGMWKRTQKFHRCLHARKCKLQ